MSPIRCDCCGAESTESNPVVTLGWRDEDGSKHLVDACARCRKKRGWTK